MDSDTLQQIRDTVRRALDKGRSPDEIREFMKKAGYSASDIDVAFDNIMPKDVQELRDALSELESKPINQIPPKPDKLEAQEEGVQLELIKGKRVCKSCGHINLPAAKFCSGCGKRF